MLNLRTVYTTILALGLSQSVPAQPSEDWTTINLAVADYHVIPRYEAFAEQGTALQAMAGDMCSNPDAQSLDRLQAQYHAAMDAWQGIQHVQFGPVTYFNWNYRLQFWPDDNGTGGRQLTALLAQQDPDVLGEDEFARASVGVQGFPALERLLFEEDSLEQLTGDPYRCQVARTIVTNIGSIAGQVYQRWTEEFRTTVQNADERGFFESAEDATIDFLKALVETMPRLRDQKLSEALGDSFAASRVRRAESWRSERSLRNIKLNLQSLEELFVGNALAEHSLSEVFNQEDVALVEQHFEELRPLLESLPDSMVAAFSTESGYGQVQALLAQVDALYEAVETALKNTDLYLGFNSLDGD